MQASRLHKEATSIQFRLQEYYEDQEKHWSSVKIKQPFLSNALKKGVVLSLSGISLLVLGVIALTPNFFIYFFPYKTNDGSWHPPTIFGSLGKDTGSSELPQLGGSCSSMQNYFNQNFGRSDTEFSNYEGQIAAPNLLGELYCDGGVMIQSLPTGKKTCSAVILYDPKTSNIRWFTDDVSANCFVSQ